MHLESEKLLVIKGFSLRRSCHRLVTDEVDRATCVIAGILSFTAQYDTSSVTA
jgi:hypothetical protein